MRNSEYQKAIARVEEHDNRVEETGERRKGILETIFDSETQITDTIQHLDGALGSFNSDEIDALAREVMDQFQSLKQKRHNARIRIESLNKDIQSKEKTERNIEEAQQQQNSLAKELGQLELPDLGTTTFSKNVLGDQRKLVGSLGKKLSKLEERIRNNEKELKEKREYLEAHLGVDERVIQEQNAVKEARFRLDVSKAIVEAVSKTAENLRERVRPSVEVNISKILPSITNGRYAAARLTEEYDVSVFSRDAQAFLSKDIFSGGTEDQFLLATRIAFAVALLPHRKNTRPQFLFLDEPLGSSDSERRLGIMNSIRTTLRESFDQIILISHVPGLEEHVDHIVVLDEGTVMTA